MYGSSTRPGNSKLIGLSRRTCHCQGRTWRPLQHCSPRLHPFMTPGFSHLDQPRAHNCLDISLPLLEAVSAVLVHPTANCFRHSSRTVFVPLIVSSKCQSPFSCLARTALAPERWHRNSPANHRKLMYICLAALRYALSGRSPHRLAWYPMAHWCTWKTIWGTSHKGLHACLLRRICYRGDT